MARIRSVHPGLFTDEAFASVSPLARILMIGIWTECDDQGVFEWKPITLKMRILPADMADVSALLAELAGVNAIAKFDVAGKFYGAVRNFQKFQRPKKPNSVYPLPAEFRNYVASSGASSEPNGSGGGGSSEPRADKPSSLPPNGGTEQRSGAQSSEPVGNQFRTSGEIGAQMEDGGGREGGKDSSAKPDSGPPTHAHTREAVPLMPSLSDPHQRWAHLGDGEEVDNDGRRHPLVAGYYLDVICALVCEAAGINDANFRGDWRPVIAWLKDGIDPHEHILPTIRKAASRPNYRPSEIRSLAYFDAAVRGDRRVA